MNFSAQVQFQLSYKVHPLQKPEKKALIFVLVCLLFPTKLLLIVTAAYSACI